MFVWTIGDAVALTGLAGCALFVAGMVAYDWAGRQVSRLVPPKPGQRWVDRQGDVYEIDEVIGGVVRHTRRWQIHRFPGEEPLARFRSRRLRLVGRRAS
ncbi:MULTISPECIES: hypothetical protein [Methylobacterium]|jgi:hypothetical protein|uniref:hypothetical protein n=1 Tax=Methylobacterium TaxID=407 RepID=UPI0008DEF390|nr:MULTISPECIES: hypothetical protein [Methylobacterium]MBZ6412696.1 hypothetical protein [Methylobacterium sp.]MBK3396703.1 hypothetical protein [Methylobacterium ajmalii]MBK3407720.1 hypothetical protein [Methylobacterium ajmalii]MBK3422207.1 hypothetical protein [Methylobacterium ajmalii]SFF27808.1 hypothetical protein SAMN04487844_11386 [Methylobacterium sp. yr596]